MNKSGLRDSIYHPYGIGKSTNIASRIKQVRPLALSQSELSSVQELRNWMRATVRLFLLFLHNKRRVGAGNQLDGREGAMRSLLFGLVTCTHVSTITLTCSVNYRHAPGTPPITSTLHGDRRIVMHILSMFVV
jgi:hypothetical protein